MRDDRLLFEMLILEGAQAGLSWLTVLQRREGYRRAFAEFDMPTVARFTAVDEAKLLLDPGIVRHRLKISAAVINARIALQIQDEFGSLHQYLWQFVGGRPIQGNRETLEGAPTRTAESDNMSKALRTRGMKFVGSTICHAYMQAVGMVNDHLTTCPRHSEVAVLGR